MHRAVLMWLLAAMGLLLSVFVFFPGVMTGDAAAVYGDMRRGFVGDWQSPVMGVVWRLIDPVSPGPGSMLLLTAALYWAGFGLVAGVVARNSVFWGLGLLGLALTPPAFVFVGVVWRDVLFGATWLLAGGLVLAFRASVAMRVVAMGLVAFGVLLRPNSLAAAPLMLGYAVWPNGWRGWRTALLVLPAATCLFGLVQLVYYDALGAKRLHPLQSVMVFDLGGISHFAGENLFPGRWTVEERRQIIEICYHPTAWDLYWTLDPCQFVMGKLEGDGVFGTPALVDAWARAVAGHPLAYATHRAAFWWTFLTDAELTLGTPDVIDGTASALRRGVRSFVLVQVPEWLAWTPLSRGGFWLLLNAGLCGVGWRRRATPAGAFVLGVCGAAMVYIGSFAVVGVATDFRYDYFAVLAGLVGVGLVCSQRRVA